VGKRGWGQDRSPLFPRDAKRPAWPVSRPAFEIGPEGKVYRLEYPADSGTSPVPPERRVEVPLPTRARQLSSDGMLVHALLSNGEVYVLNPGIIVSEMGFFPIDGMSEEAARYQYWGNFRWAGHAPDVPLRINAAQEICRI